MKTPSHHLSFMACLALTFSVTGCNKKTTSAPAPKPALSTVSPDPVQLEKTRAKQAPATKKTAEESYQEQAKRQEVLWALSRLPPS